ncbi:MAG TPA: class I SAM-dependent methyltransferase [Kiritimatiellia bacterium]|mgnify:CR=1 FL=1|nr:class I SAM-dependent methyltransferase [Kiritimatiellia bacterium]
MPTITQLRDMIAVRAAEAECPYPEKADIESSSDPYAGRFHGSAGAWMLEVQEAIALSLLAATSPLHILDVGGGHGQLARPLVRAGHHVTVLSSHPACRHRIHDLIHPDHCAFDVGDVVALPYPDRSFDAVFCFRLTTHCSVWPQLISELCRVARHTVILDYPTKQSLNAIAPLLFSAKKKIETNTRTWTLFTHRDIRQAFATHRFLPASRKGQFFFPMVIHRIIKNRTLSRALETASRTLGLNHLFGSPVIARFDRNP